MIILKSWVNSTWFIIMRFLKNCKFKLIIQIYDKHVLSDLDYEPANLIFFIK